MTTLLQVELEALQSEKLNQFRSWDLILPFARIEYLKANKFGA